MMIGSNSVSFLNYMFHLIMGRMLGPANYGELASIISLVSLLGIIPTSVNLVVIKYISAAKDKRELAALVSWLRKKILMVAGVASVIIFVTSPLISSFLNIDKTFFLTLVAISFFFSMQALLNRSILQGLLRFKEMVLTLLIEVGAKLLISVVLVYLGFQVFGALTGFTLSTVFGWYIASLLIPRSKGLLAPANISKMLVFIIPVTIQGIATTSLISSDVILVKHFFISSDAGIYAALSTLGKIIFFGAGPISAVMFPLISQRAARGENYKKIFIFSLIATAALATVILLLYWLFPGFAVRLLFGPGYLEAANLLIWFGLFISFFTLSYLLVNYGLSLGKTSIVILPSLAAALQILIIWFFHQNLFTVVFISVVLSALLLLSLLIYFTYAKQSSI